MAVDLVLRISRNEDNRLTGTVSISGASDARDFSGTLELMRAFEELVPVMPADSERDVPADVALAAGD